MQHDQTFSTYKIITFSIFICVALITSLFLFHLRQTPQQNIIANDQSMMFSLTREIKPFQLIREDQSKFTQFNLLNHWTLLFFGFTHCASICPTTLDMLNKTYTNLYRSYPNLQVVFVSLDPERDTPKTLSHYMHSFNNKFIGVSGKIQELRKLQSQFGIFSARDPNTSSDNYQLQHSNSILLINPEGRWAGLFKFGLNPEQFLQAFRASTKVGAHT